MKKMLSVLAVLLCTLFYDIQIQAQNAPCSECGNLVISAVVNGRTNGRHGIQLCAINDIPDLSNYHFTYSDDNLSDSEFIGYDRDGTSSISTATILSGSLLAGECLWIVNDSTDFEEFMEGTFDFAAPDVDGSISVAVEDDENLMIICKGNIDDLYGTYIAALDEDEDFMTNATDEIDPSDPAYYGDTWIVSNNDRCPNGGTFDLSNWTVGPIDDMDGADFISETSFPGANYSHSNPGACSNVRTCGGLQLCTEVRYECVEDPDGLDDFLMSIDYIGMEPGITLTLLELYGCNITIHPSSDDPATTPDGTIVLLNEESTSGCGTSSTLWGIEYKSPGCDGIQFWDRVPENCILTCSNGMQDGDEEGVDCGGSCPNICSTGDPCTNGVQDGDEEGVDCGGSCPTPCSTDDPCTNGVQDGDEEGIDCGGSCPTPCPTGDTCSNGVQDGDEEGIDCGGSCPTACMAMATCDDGVQNGDEEGIDCGGSCPTPCPTTDTCSNGVQDGDEEGIDCGGTACAPCGTVAAIPTMSQWGLILLTLLTLTFVSISVVSRQGSLAGVNRTFTMSDAMQLRNYPFNRNMFFKAALFVAFAALIAAVGTFAVYGFLTMTDIVGTFIAGPVLAYLIHLLAMVNEQEK